MEDEEVDQVPCPSDVINNTGLAPALLVLE